MRDPRIGFKPEHKERMTLEEVRLEYARECYLALIRTGHSPNVITWEQAMWSADKAFPQ